MPGGPRGALPYPPGVILVTGATGNIGRKVVDQLLAAGAPHVRALTADPARAALPAGVEVVTGHLRRPAAVAEALEGVGSLYLTSLPDATRSVLAQARAAGVRHVVDLSGEPESWWGEITAAVEASGLAWTHLWPGDFMENALSWGWQIRGHGTVREPFPQAASSPTAMDDIAAVAARALLDPDAHVGRAHLLTGPETLTRVEMVDRVAAALGRPVPFVTVTRDEAVALFTPEMGGDAAWYVDAVLGAAAEHAVPPNRLVEEITGRPATTFAQWAVRHADAFRPVGPDGGAPA